MTACIMSSSLKSTPVSTPRRLSLAESFTNLRDSTKTMSTSLGLVRLMQERGISAAVYNPQSWDRADTHDTSPTAPAAPRVPSTLPPSTLLDSPSGQSQTLPSPTSAPFQFSSSSSPYDNFLASRPASSILREVREEARGLADCESQTDVSVHNLQLVDKLKRFSVARTEVAGPGTVAHTPLLGPLSGLRRPCPLFGHPVVTSDIGGIPALNTGIRRNRSYPAMVGASMVMKGSGPSRSDTPLQAKLPKQTSLK